MSQVDPNAVRRGAVTENLNQGTADFQRDGLPWAPAGPSCVVGVAPSASAAGFRCSQRQGKRRGAEEVVPRHHLLAAAEWDSAGSFLFTDSTPEITVLIAVTLHVRL